MENVNQEMTTIAFPQIVKYQLKWCQMVLSWYIDIIQILLQNIWPVINCIQVLFVTGCILRMSHSDESWRNYDHKDAITNLPEVDNAMPF